MMKLRKRRAPVHAAALPTEPLIVGACLCLVAFLTGCTPPGPRALLDGKRAIEQGKYALAVTKLKSATTLLTTNAQAWNYLGLACHYAGQIAEAEKAYQRALLLDRDLSEAHYNLGCLLLAQPKVDAAKMAKLQFMAFLLRRGNSAEGLVKLGLAQLRSGEPNEAEKSFTEALRLQPQNAQAWNGLGLTKLQHGRASEAAQAFSNALQRRPGYSPALLNLAIVYQQHLNNRPLALQKYREYIASSPAADGIEAVKNLARHLEDELNPAPHATEPSAAPRNLTNATTARPTATNLAASAPSNPPSPTHTGTGARDREPGGRAANSDAVASAPKASAALPSQRMQPAVSTPPAQETEPVRLPPEQVFMAARDVAPPAISNNGVAAEPSPPLPLADSPSPPAAQPGFFQRINPLNLFRHEAKLPTTTTPLPRTTAPRAASIAGVTPQPGSSSEDDVSPSSTAPGRYPYKWPAKPAPGNRAEAERLLAQGLRAQQEQQVSQALEDYRRAAQLDPAFFEAQYNLGQAATQAGDLSTALMAYEYALAIRPDSLDARYNFALVLKQRNYLADAVNEMQKVASAPHEARANLALGNLYAQQLHQPAKAREHYLKVLEADPQLPQADAVRYWLAAHPQ